VDYTAQYSAANAWNLNTNNGNMNNNNKTNNNRVRAVSAFFGTPPTDEPVSLYDIIEAYYAFRKHKTSTENEIRFEMSFLRKCESIRRELNARKFHFGRCVMFLQPKPVLREVVASMARTRCAQTWAAIRLLPILEEVLDDCMMSNRPKRGTGGAVKRAYKLGMGHQNGWVVGFDLQGFFMSIDKRIAARMWDELIIECYQGIDIAELRAFVHDVMMWCPQKHAVQLGDKDGWNHLASHKSLFCQDDYHGLPIGDILSQMTALLILNEAVKWLKAHGIEDIVEYVDDFLIFTDDIDHVKGVWPEFRRWLKEELSLTLHPRKSSMQPVRHGWHFVGSKCKPFVMFPSDRCVRNINASIIKIERDKPDINKVIPSINSQIGYIKSYATYKMRRGIADRLFDTYPRQVYFTDAFGVAKPTRRYSRRWGIRTEIMYNRTNR